MYFLSRPFFVVSTHFLEHKVASTQPIEVKLSGVTFYAFPRPLKHNPVFGDLGANFGNFASYNSVTKCSFRHKSSLLSHPFSIPTIAKVFRTSAAVSAALLTSRNPTPNPPADMVSQSGKKLDVRIAEFLLELLNSCKKPTILAKVP